MNCVHPLFLKAKATARTENNLNWYDDTMGDFADEYWDAMRVETKTIESMGSWKVFER